MTKEELVASVNELLNVSHINCKSEIYGKVLHQRCKALLVAQSKIRDNMSKIQLSKDFENNLEKIRRVNILNKRYHSLNKKIGNLIEST